jgi:hypothetical protein
MCLWEEGCELFADRGGGLAGDLNVALVVVLKTLYAFRYAVQASVLPVLQLPTPPHLHNP